MCADADWDAHVVNATDLVNSTKMFKKKLTSQHIGLQEEKPLNWWNHAQL